MAEEQDEQQRQQNILDLELVPINEQVKNAICNFRIVLEKTQPDVIYKVYLDILKQYYFYNAFIATADALEIYMQQFWHIVAYDLTAKAHLFMIDNQEELKYQIKSTRVSKQKQELMPFSRGSGEGSRVTLKVRNELTLEVHDVTSKVLDKPSDHSSGSNSDSEFVVKDISSDEADIIEKAEEAKKAKTEKDTDEQMTDEQVIVKQVVEEEHDDGQGGNEQVGNAQANVHMIEPLVEKPEATNVNNKVTRLEKKVYAISSFNLPDAIDKSGKAYLKNVLLKDVPEFGKIKIEKAKEIMPKHLSTPFDQAALDEFEQKDKLF
nr:hypothetical protein [Tanacetum cinerariifolium]